MFSFHCSRWGIWTMRDQSSASTAVLPASQSHLWFRVKSNWTWPQHRPAQESEWMNQRSLQDQTQPAQCPKGKKEMEGLGKQRYLHILRLGYHRTTLQYDPGHKVQQVERALVSKQDMNISTGIIWGSALAWPTMDCYQPGVLVTWWSMRWGARTKENRYSIGLFLAALLFSAENIGSAPHRKEMLLYSKADLVFGARSTTFFLMGGGGHNMPGHFQMFLVDGCSCHHLAKTSVKPWLWALHLDLGAAENLSQSNCFWAPFYQKAYQQIRALAEGLKCKERLC